MLLDLELREVLVVLVLLLFPRDGTNVYAAVKDSDVSEFVFQLESPVDLDPWLAVLLLEDVIIVAASPAPAIFRRRRRYRKKTPATRRIHGMPTAIPIIIPFELDPVDPVLEGSAYIGLSAQ